MDSGYLNVFCDDSLITYDGDMEYWPSNNIDMQMLTETLDGILPVSPTDFHTNDHLNFSISLENIGVKYGDNIIEGQFEDDNAVELMTIDENSIDYDTYNENSFHNHNNDEQYSNNTFSSVKDHKSFRVDEILEECTNQDNDIVIKSNENISIDKEDENKKKATDHDNKNHKKSQLEDIIPEIDDTSLDLNIDANNFDLAEFITQDDLVLSTPTELVHIDMKKHANDETVPFKQNKNIEEIASTKMSSVLPKCSGNIVVISPETDQSDVDSDAIIDVETVEENENISNIFSNQISVEDIISVTDIEEDNENIAETFIDNIKEDPSWDPPKIGNKKSDNNSSVINEKSNKANEKCSNKDKVRKRKLKNQNCNDKKDTRKGKTKKLYKKKRNSTGATLNGQSFISDNKHQYIRKCPTANYHENTKLPAVKRKLNLEEYKKRRGLLNLSKNDNSTFHAEIDKSVQTVIDTQKEKMSHNIHSAEVTSIVKSLKEEQQQFKPQLVDPITLAKNKVLKMQELKRAQQLRIIDSTVSAKVPKVTKLPPLNEIVKTTDYYMKGIETKYREKYDDLIKAKLSVSQSKIDYEEIITISVSCNTDITIPPLPFCNGNKTLNKATQSLLKSTALLTRVSKTTDNVTLTKNSLIASIQNVVEKNVVNENQSKCNRFKNGNEKYLDIEHHGEDKIIMHLRKDRIRPIKCTIGVQTDYQTQFPTLSMLTSSHVLKHKSRKAQRLKNYGKTNGSCSDTSDQLIDSEQSDSCQSRHPQSREGSYSSSLERIRIYDSAIGTGYSSRGSYRNCSSISSSYSESCRSRRRQRRTSYKQRQRKHSRNSNNNSCTSTTTTDSSDFEHSHSSRRAKHYRLSPVRSRSRSYSRSKSNTQNDYRKHYTYKNDNNNNNNNNISSTAVEERRIVFVGHIEEKTTKDMLRKKFLPYGTIKHISIHYKENGMKFGFVTYERAQDAFAAIDNSTRDPLINMYDVSFGGRRAFCRATYADLDNAGINTYHSYVLPENATKRLKEKADNSFDTLLMQMKAKLNANKKTLKQSNQNKVANKI